MKITEIKINIVRNQNPLKAFASITIDNCLAIHDLKIIKTESKVFVAMPSKKITDEAQQQKYKDIVHPINKEARDQIEKLILDKYYKIAEEND